MILRSSPALVWELTRATLAVQAAMAIEARDGFALGWSRRRLRSVAAGGRYRSTRESS